MVCMGSNVWLWVEEAIVDDSVCYTLLVALTVVRLIAFVSKHLPLLLLVDGVHP